MASRCSGSTSSVHGKKQKKSPLFKVKLNIVMKHHRKNEQQYSLTGILAFLCILIQISFLLCICQFSFQHYRNINKWSYSGLWPFLLLFCYHLIMVGNVSLSNPCSVILYRGTQHNYF